MYEFELHLADIPHLFDDGSEYFLDLRLIHAVDFEGEDARMHIFAHELPEGDEVATRLRNGFGDFCQRARFVFDEKEERLAHDGDGIVVAAGTYHNVINTSKTEPLKLYTIYSPPNHPDGTVHKTKAEAEAAEKLHA